MTDNGNLEHVFRASIAAAQAEAAGIRPIVVPIERLPTGRQLAIIHAQLALLATEHEVNAGQEAARDVLLNRRPSAPEVDATDGRISRVPTLRVVR